MRHLAWVFILINSLLGAVSAQTPQTINTVADEGAWCWFADPRAIHHESRDGAINNTYIGYIDVHGSIKATQVNHLTGTTNEVLIRSWFQPDDHNNPTFLVLPDERVMVFYSRHTDESCFYYRVSERPGDITTLGKEVRLETDHHTTYPSPFILSDDPDHIYLCWRGIGWHPTIARLTIPDASHDAVFDWGPYQLVQSNGGRSGVRPYAKYVSNGKDRIYMAYTTTHPDNQPVNYLYCNYIDIQSKELRDIRGNKLATVGSGQLHGVEASAAYRQAFPFAVVDDTPLRNWLWEVALDAAERPVLATVGISEDKTAHDYYYIRWTGNDWQKTFLSHAGGHFHQSPGIEQCYSGGMTIDKHDPQVVYGAVPVAGEHGLVYELKKFTVGADGKVVATKQLTFDSEKNNVRPYTFAGVGGTSPLVWMYGDYYDWIVSESRPQGFPTAIHTDMQIPEDASSADGFTLAMVVTYDSAAYHGDIVQFVGLAYGVPNDSTPRPYVTDGQRTYTSTNVLGNSDGWRHQRRGTGGQWYAPVRPKTFHLAITYSDGVLRTYLDGLLDQSIELAGLQLGDVSTDGPDGMTVDLNSYDKALAQDEVKALAAASRIPDKAKVLATINQVNTYWQSHHEPQQWAFWDVAAYHTGNMAAYEVTHNEDYRRYSEAWANHNQWKGAKSDNRSAWKYSYGETDEHVLFGDWQICFQTYIDLYRLDPDTIKIARALEVMGYQMRTPNDDYWWWADGLYMVMPVMTKLYHVTGDARYLDKLVEYFDYAKTLMYDEEEHLFYRDAKYIYPKHTSTNGKKDFWARGDGWVFAGLANVLQDLPRHDRRRAVFETVYLDMAEAIVNSQQVDGYWTRSMLDPNHAPGPETSGTAFFTYGLLWGLNHGYLEGAAYTDAALKGWRYLSGFALQPDGRVGYVQPIGERAIPGQTVDARSTAGFGVGAFLLAGSELVKYIGSQSHDVGE